MTPTDSRNRMISFRLSPEEYNRFRDLCFSHGLRSLSELARIAMHNFVSQPIPTAAQTSLDARVADLESRLQFLSQELKALRHINRNGAAPTSDNDNNHHGDQQQPNQY